MQTPVPSGTADFSEFLIKKVIVLTFSLIS